MKRCFISLLVFTILFSILSCGKKLVPKPPEQSSSISATFLSFQNLKKIP